MKQKARELLKLYCDFVGASQRLPSLADMVSLNVNRNAIRYYFGSMTAFATAARKYRPAVFKRLPKMSKVSAGSQLVYELLGVK